MYVHLYVHIFTYTIIHHILSFHLIGEITSSQSYQECVQLGIEGKSEFSIVPDKTRLHAKHDLNISEIRELLLSLFSDEAIVPKYFSVRNKGYIRNVIVLHVSDSSDPIALLTGYI
jgi:hypothetical protein